MDKGETNIVPVHMCWHAVANLIAIRSRHVVAVVFDCTVLPDFQFDSLATINAMLLGFHENCGLFIHRIADTGLIGSGTVTKRLAKYSVLPGITICDTAGLEDGPLQGHERCYIGALLDGHLHDGNDMTSRAFQVDIFKFNSKPPSVGE